MQYKEAVPQDEEEVELISDNDEASPQKWTSFKLGAIGLSLAVFAIASVACAVKLMGQASEDNAPANTARALLESPEMAKVMADNHKKWSKRKLEANGEIQGAHQKFTKEIMKIIQRTSPKSYEQLNELPLSEEQKRSVLNVVRNLADDRLQTVGKQIAKIAKDSASSGKKGKYLEGSMKRKLMEHFHQNKDSITDLRNEIIPNSLRKHVDKKAEMKLDTENMRLFRYSKASWDALEKAEDSRRLQAPSSPISALGSSSSDDDDEIPGLGTNADDLSEKFGQGLGVVAGMLEQCRVALDQIDFVGESFDVDMKIPYWAKSMVGGLDFVAEMSDCLLRDGVADGVNDENTNMVKLGMCPLKYASAATDFLESIDNVMGFDNAHNGFSLFGSDDAASTPAAGAPSVYQQAPAPYYHPAPQPGYYPPQPVYHPGYYAPTNAQQVYR
jgi:hypothetical protein